MSFIKDPGSIETESMRIIRSKLKISWPENEIPVVQRLIHTSGDLSLENVIVIHPQAIQAGLQALKQGANIITDVEMVKTGISKQNMERLGGKVECFLNDPRVPQQAQDWGITRSMTALRLNAEKLAGAIVAIGNAPTALFELLRLAEDPACRPALVIGIPVGFVGAAESKELLWQRQDLPSVIVKGTRGGSPLAVAAVNALIYVAINRTI
ncbi:MAG TPA: precorrin-8X methylmutase [Desulfitobacteriaceae bacterium]|nr:precorrin-8X methylmutase [Desulfitobacteriaceae bacterium]